MSQVVKYEQKPPYLGEMEPSVWPGAGDVCEADIFRREKRTKNDQSERRVCLHAAASTG